MATINVSSYGDGTPSLVNAAAAYAASSPNDTIVFPTGTAYWPSGLTITRPLILMGGGTGTLGTRLIASGTSMNEPIFNFTNINTGSLVRVSNFTFDLVDVSNLTFTKCAVRTINVDLSSLRIDHNEFRYGYSQLIIGGSMGVIDHNLFYNPLKGIDYTAGTNAQALASWADMSAGTANALFVETNLFLDDANFSGITAQERIGTENGGKLVVRYNEFNSDNVPTALTDNSWIEAFQTHGSAPGGVPPQYGYWQQGSGARRGQSVVEYYNNNLHGKRVPFMATFRGSANLAYNNILNTVIGSPARFYLREEESTSSWVPSRTGWPAEDQVHNSFFWNNTFNGASQTLDNFVTGDIPEFILPNRDFWLHAPEASGGYEYFSGYNGASNGYPTNGGTISGVPYPTSGTMLFSPTGANAYYGYVPYTYPHPLTGPFYTLKRWGNNLRFVGLAV